MSRIITLVELQRLTLEELQVLHRKIQEDLASAGRDSAARREALASLENIRRVIALRLAQRAPRPRF